MGVVETLLAFDFGLREGEELGKSSRLLEAEDEEATTVGNSNLKQFLGRFLQDMHDLEQRRAQYKERPIWPGIYVSNTVGRPMG